MIEFAAKILIGTAFYVSVLWLAQRNPRATGMMLTFPTLNGPVLLLAPPDALEATAAAMLLMPVLNGILSASYLHGFDRLLDWKFSPPDASGLMLAATSMVWLGAASTVAAGRWVVPSAQQGIYILGSIIAGLALSLALKPARIIQLRAGSPQRLDVLVRCKSRRIVLFTLTLAAVATVGRLGGSPALLGHWRATGRRAVRAACDRGGAGNSYRG